MAVDWVRVWRVLRYHGGGLVGSLLVAASIVLYPAIVVAWSSVEPRPGVDWELVRAVAAAAGCWIIGLALIFWSRPVRRWAQFANYGIALNVLVYVSIYWYRW